MNIYNKVLLIVNKVSTPSAKYNELTKLYYSTEDTKLKGLIRLYSEFLLEEHNCKGAKLQNAYNRVVNASEECKNNLVDYCTEAKLSSKPEWQILAERYGWRPKE